MSETRLIYSAVGDSKGKELWITNGVTPVRLTDLYPNSGNSIPVVLGQVGKWVYFDADNGNGRDLYRLDTSTMLVSTIGPANSSPLYVTSTSGALFLSMDDGVHGRELWVANASGSVASTGDTFTDGSFSPSYGGSIGGTALFAGNDETKGTELFASTGGAPTLVKDINPSGNSDPGSIGGFFTFGNTVLFDANDGGGPTLWSSNGSTASEVSTVELPQDFFAYNNGSTTKVLFNGQTPGGFTQYLYVTNGTGGGTSRITTAVTDPSGFTLYKGKVYFSGYDSAHGRELWVTDGTSGGTELAVDLDFTSASSSPANMFVLNGKLLFTDNQQRLWATDGTDPGTHLIRNFLSAGNFVVVGTQAYFVAYTSSGKYQIWKTDGTTATVTDLVPGNDTLAPTLQGLITIPTSTTPSNGPDLLNGNSSNNTIDGLKGNDTINGNAGADTLKGGDGNDVLKGGAGKDSLDGGANTDTADFSDKTQSVNVTLNAGAGTAYVNGTAAANAEDALKAIENVTGGSAADRLIGDTGNNKLTGNNGNDFLSGGSGADSLLGGNNNDVLRGGVGKDSLDGGANSDTADFSDKTVKVTVTLNAGSGTAYFAGVAEDTLKGIENLSGGTAGDALAGDAFANIIRGNAGNDIVKGNGGNDILFGGLGNDTLDGGANNDQFRFDLAPNTTTNFDHIVSFTAGADDLVLENSIFAVGASLTSAEFLSRSSGHSATNGTQRIIYDKATGELWYDSDGNATGHAAIKFAVLDNKPAGLGLGDFIIV